MLLLAAMVDGSTDDAELRIARLLTGLGWVLEGGLPVDRRAVVGMVAEDVHLLRHIGALDGDRWESWPSAVTSGGVALARAALTDTQR